MAVYRKKLVDKDGNTIIPAVGDIYGTVYNATLSSATAGGRADYEFTPDTPVENNKVYAVMFPAPTVNNATIILGDGVVSGSILVPPVAATDSPNYELLTTDMINNTEPLLLMYSGVQWVCLNQKKKVATADLEDKAVKSAKIDWATFPGNYKTSETDTRQTWVDGQKIYKRTVVFNNLGNTGVVEKSISGVGRVVDFEATMYSGSNSWKIPYKYVDIVSFEQGKLRINSLTDLRQYSAAITIYYVKSA